MERKKPELIVMLTYNDATVADAMEIFEQCRDSRIQFWGFKEATLPPEQMKALYARMKACSKTTVLEVVAYSPQEGMDGARLAAWCGCDILMGTIFSDEINDFCRENGIKYMPFVGTVTGRPSVLSGDIDGMIDEARTYLEKGVYGIDLLGYRYTGDPAVLNERFVSEIDAPVCIAGSINSWQRLEAVSHAAPWAFTIGSAFFDKKFGGNFKQQIETVNCFIKGNMTEEKDV